MLKITIDARAGEERLKKLPPAVRWALAVDLQSLADRFVGEAEALAPKRSGNLAGAIRDKVKATERRVIATVDIAPGKARAYANIQDKGGKTRPHDILAKKASVLAFAMGGKTVFARSVKNPGATIPAHPYMRSTLDQMTDEIRASLIDAVKQVAAAQ